MGASKSSTVSVPLPTSLAGAIAASASLTHLAARLRESEQRLASIAPLLPDSLARELRPGPIDDEGWSVLVSNAAVAAKLRQLLPRLSQELKARSFRDLPIRVRLRAYWESGAWCRLSESNGRPSAYKAGALPAELSRRPRARILGRQGPPRQ